MKKRSQARSAVHGAAHGNRRYLGKRSGMMPDTVDGVNVERRFSSNSAEWDPHLTHFDPTSAPMPKVDCRTDAEGREG